MTLRGAEELGSVARTSWAGGRIVAVDGAFCLHNLGIQRVAGNSARRLAALAQRKQVLAASFASSSATVAAATAAPAGAGGATHGADAVELLFQRWDADGSGDIDPAELAKRTYQTSPPSRCISSSPNKCATRAYRQTCSSASSRRTSLSRFAGARSPK